MKEVHNILNILKKTKDAIKKEDIAAIKGLSNQTINTASLTQDADNIAVAVIVYSLSKILERKDYRNLPGWRRFYKIIIVSLNNSIKDVEEKNEEKFGKDIALIRKAINKVSGKLRKYIQDVFRTAQINKASRIYAHGISMEKTARLLGVTMYELAEYAGKTGIPEAPLGHTYSVKPRIKFAMEMFE